MQPQRELTTGPLWKAAADMAAILTHSDLVSAPRAANVWAAIYASNGLQPGAVALDATQVAGMVGLKQSRSVDSGSKGAPAILDRLDQLGAIDWDGRHVRYVASPEEAALPRQRNPRAESSPPLTGMPDDLDSELPQSPTAPPRVVPLPRREEREEFPEPPDLREERANSPAQTVGGKGGDALASNPKHEQHEKQQQRRRGERVDFPEQSQTAAWDEVREMLIAAGVYISLLDGLISKARDHKASPGDVKALCDYYERNRVESGFNAGALKNAVAHWRPGISYEAPALWPREKPTNKDRYGRTQQTARSGVGQNYAGDAAKRIGEL